MTKRVKEAVHNKETVSIAYDGNVVEVWETFDKENLAIDLGSDQTSLHNPWAGGYYPIGLSYEEANEMMANQPLNLKKKYKKAYDVMLRQLINILQKELISLTTEMPFYWRPQELVQMY